MVNLSLLVSSLLISASIANPVPTATELVQRGPELARRCATDGRLARRHGPDDDCGGGDWPGWPWKRDAVAKPACAPKGIVSTLTSIVKRHGPDDDCGGGDWPGWPWKRDVVAATATPNCGVVSRLMRLAKRHGPDDDCGGGDWPGWPW